MQKITIDIRSPFTHHAVEAREVMPRFIISKGVD